MITPGSEIMPNDPEGIAAEIKRRGITRLCHFTTIDNLSSILRYGLLSRDHLLQNGLPFHFNDPSRFDGKTSHICLSVEHPNGYLLADYKSLSTLVDRFMILVIEPLVMTSAGTLFTPGNAATSGIQMDSGLSGLQRLFSKKFLGRNGKPVVRKSQQPSCPTDIQAEVLIPHHIPRESILGIVTETPDAASRVKAIINDKKLVLPVEVKPRFYQRDLQNSFLQYGGVVKLSLSSVG